MPLCGYTSSDLALLGHLPLQGKAFEQNDKLKFDTIAAISNQVKLQDVNG